MKILQMAAVTPGPASAWLFLADDGTLCVMDGGLEHHADQLWAALQHWGGQNPHIRYWFLSHAHLDHCDAFLKLYARRGIDFTLDELVYTFPASAAIDLYEPEYKDTIHSFEALAPAHIEPHVGDVFDLGCGARLHTLQVFSEEETGNLINNSCTVWQLKTEGVSLLFLSDLGQDAGNRLLRAYGDRLKSDLVQMAHHGENGVARPVYEAVQPDICLWDTPGWLWKNTADPLRPGQGPWKTLETRRWMEELGVETHAITKDGSWEICLCDHAAHITAYTGEETP